MRATAPLLAAALLLAGGGAAAQAPPWDPRFFNPPELARPDDVVLPLPCGGAMAFRPVVTPAETRDALADGAVQLGRSNEQTGYLDYLRRQHLLGTLSGPDGTWRFLMGKFAVTLDQWNAVMAEPAAACAAPTESGRKSKGEASWFEAVGYARRLTEWLLRERRGALPQQEEETAYLRLPTEAEWEFAARGGIAVGGAQFAAERPFPEGEPLAAHAVFREPGRTREARPVGSRKPNPLGLHDMLGNVEQWVLEPFRANRLGREHGQTGGLVTRGGSYDTEEPGIRTALRSEYAPFNRTTGLAWRHPKIGFRLVVAAPVLSSAQRTEALQQAWIALNRAGGGGGVGVAPAAAAAADPAEELTRLAAEATDPALRARLEGLRRQVLVERGQRDEAQGRLFRTGLLNGALLVRGLRQDLVLAETFGRQSREAHERLDAARKGGNAAAGRQEEALLRAAEAGFAQAELRRRLGVRAYTDAVAQMAQDVPPEQQRAQGARLAQALEAGELDALKPFVALFDRALTAYRARPGMGTEMLVRLITE